jgi:hypothetical protein
MAQTKRRCRSKKRKKRHTHHKRKGGVVTTRRKEYKEEHIRADKFPARCDKIIKKQEQQIKKHWPKDFKQYGHELALEFAGQEKFCDKCIPHLKEWKKKLILSSSSSKKSKSKTSSPRLTRKVGRNFKEFKGKSDIFIYKNSGFNPQEKRRCKQLLKQNRTALKKEKERIFRKIRIPIFRAKKQFNDCKKCNHIWAKLNDSSGIDDMSGDEEDIWHQKRARVWREHDTRWSDSLGMPSKCRVKYIRMKKKETKKEKARKKKEKEEKTKKALVKSKKYTKSRLRDRSKIKKKRDTSS